VRTGIFGSAMAAAVALLEAKQGSAFLSGHRIGPGVRSHRTARRVTANLSRHHPDFGLSPAKHNERKALRAAGKLPFVEKRT
jgi:hypothetical protein